jgi:hypothetical protein
LGGGAGVIGIDLDFTVTTGDFLLEPVLNLKIRMQIHALKHPHPRSLSRRKRDEKPFSLWEKGGDEGKV